MKFIENIFKTPKRLGLLLVVVIAILAARTLIFQGGYFNMHDDLQMMRQLQMEKCFLDGQFPCRWVQDMGRGFGFPLFNYYPPFPYLIGEVFRVFGVSFMMTAKLTFALSFLVAGVGMYLLAGEFFGVLGGVVAATFYTWAPYYAVDVYVRGAMNEAWALAWFPFIFWAGYKLLKSKKNKINKWTIGLSLSWFALLASHNLMVMILTPLFGVWMLIHLWQEKKWKLVPQLIKSGFLAFGLAAFFTIPAVLEQKYVQIETLTRDYFEFIAHFATVGQLLFSRFWGYGGSAWGMVNDKMSFQVGHFHWILSLIIGVWIIYKLIKGTKKIAISNSYFVILFMFLAGWFSLFMAHNKSTFIWKLFTPLEFVQFPWRFLTLATFAFSFLAGGVVLILKRYKYKNLIIGVLTLGLLVFNWNYFLPSGGRMGELTDEEKFSGVAWELQQGAGILDYLPAWAKEPPNEIQTDIVEIIEGEGEIKDADQGTNWINFKTNTVDEILVRINTFYFPNWKVFVDGVEVETFVPEDESWGRMYVSIPSGEHLIEASFEDTLPRTIGNYLSFFAWIGLLLWLLNGKIRAK